MSLYIRQLIEEDLIGHPNQSDPVFDCVSFALELEDQGYEDGLLLTNSVSSVDWDHFPVIYKQYRENINKYKRDQYKLEHGLPKKQRIKLKVCKQCSSYYYDPNYRTSQLFCSRECWARSKIKIKPIIICEICNKEFTQKEKRTKCCSKECAAGKAKKTMQAKFGRKVLQICKTTNMEIAKYKTLTEAANKTETHASTISRACKKPNSSAGGYFWRYSDA